MYIFLAHTLSALLSYGTGDFLYPIERERTLFETAFDTNVHVEASASYPNVRETTPLTRHANEALRKEAHELYNAFVQEMRAPQQELWEGDAEEFVLRYELDLVYSTHNLMSFYGSKYRYSGGAHGSVQYITKTFWQKDNTISELSLSDLFLPGARTWLFQYCENYFKSNRCGYYSYDDYSWVGFNSEHLDAFILTEKGLLLVFQNYVVSGYDDDPMTLLIPYAKLVSILNSDSPLLFFLEKSTETL